jgi:hypothetical protein
MPIAPIAQQQAAVFSTPAKMCKVVIDYILMLPLFWQNSFFSS